MKWSQLPKEYKDLIDNLSDEDKEIIELNYNNSLPYRFIWERTKQGFRFWRMCDNCTSIINLPPIPK